MSLVSLQTSDRAGRPLATPSGNHQACKDPCLDLKGNSPQHSQGGENFHLSWTPKSFPCARREAFYQELQNGLGTACLGSPPPVPLNLFLIPPPPFSCWGLR